MIVSKVTIHGVRAVAEEQSPITAGMVGAQVQLEYADPVWDGLRRNVVFYGTQVRSVVTDETLVTIPAEVIAKANVILVMGVYGTDETGTVVIPTLLTELGTVRYGASPARDATTDPALPVWAQLMTMIGNLNALNTQAKTNLVAAVNEAFAGSGGVGEASLTAMLADALTQARESGEFKGEKGDPGKDGIMATVSLDSGVFAMHVDANGHLILTHNDCDPTPPLSIDGEGHLVYAIN